MNASMARRIRDAEATLISAIDRNQGGRREWSQHKTAQPRQQEARFSGPIQGENRMAMFIPNQSPLCLAHIRGGKEQWDRTQR
jgi:hypothetical protein